MPCFSAKKREGPGPSLLKSFCKNSGNDLQCPVDCFIWNVQRGQQSDFLFGREHQHALFQACRHQFRRRARRFHAQHQTHTGNAENALHIFEAFSQFSALAAHAGKQRFINAAENAQCACGRHGIAAKGGAVISRPQRVLHLLSQQANADGQAAADALGGGEKVRLNAKLFVGVQRARVAVARLHLVHRKEYVPLLA